MENITCRRACNKDVECLTRVSINSFHSDFKVGAASKIGGPPAYNSHSFHRKMINASKAFYVILDGSKIIGGFFIFQKSKTQMELTRIFIDPKYIRNGIGTRSINYLIRKYPQIKTWTLDTPKWNIRTKNFYRKMGFRLVDEDHESCHFAKEIY